MGSIPSGGNGDDQANNQRQLAVSIHGRRAAAVAQRPVAKCTNWMSADELIEHLEEGDLIEFDRELYKHWGVYVHLSTDGVYCVVHLSGDVTEQATAKLSACSTSNCGVGALVDTKLGNSLGASLTLDGQVAIVQSADLKSIANTQRCRVNNMRDYEFRPYAPNVVISRATSELGKQKYNALFTNCEHFATWCRYGTKSSNQASTFKMLATGMVVGVGTWSAVNGVMAAGAVYAATRLGRRMVNRMARGRVGW